MNNSIYSVQELRALARRLDRADNCTPCHSEKVANYAMELCRALNIRGGKKDLIITACLIHDVGKIGVDSDIWSKTEKLSAMDWHKIKMHPVISAQLAQKSGCGQKIVEMIYYHHVWYNGNGYPHAEKKGSRIPIGARIIAVCDAYEAMISQRPYRQPLSPQEAIEELRRNSVRQFDPKIMEVFIKVLGAEASG